MNWHSVLFLYFGRSLACPPCHSINHFINLSPSFDHCVFINFEMRILYVYILHCPFINTNHLQFVEQKANEERKKSTEINLQNMAKSGEKGKKSKWLMTSFSVQSKPNASKAENWIKMDMSEMTIATALRKKNYKSHSVVYLIKMMEWLKVMIRQLVLSFWTLN